jgi:V8-like Glu-specific endopeptidase
MSLIVKKYSFVFIILLFTNSCVKEQNNTNYNNKLNGIALFEGPMSCTASFIEIPNMNPDSPAIVITNGHCASDFYSDNTIHTNSLINATLIFNKLEGVSEDKWIQVKAKKLLYSTMKGMDLAIIQLDISNKLLMEKGVVPIKISTSAPFIGSKLITYGYPRFLNPLFLRKSEDYLGKSSNVSEFIWLWKNLFSSKFQNIYSGSSGSPVFASNENALFGIINTTTIGAIGECELGAPCEIKKNEKPKVLDNTSYIVDVTSLYKCFNNGVFDLNHVTFPYEKPSSFSIKLKNDIRNFNSNQLGQDIELIIDDPSNTSYKVESFKEFDPMNSNNFINNNSSIIYIQKPIEEAFYVISVMKNNKFNEVKYLTFKNDFSAPSENAINIESISTDSEGYSVRPIFKYPELTQFDWKHGSESNCNCNDPNGYITFNRIPVQVSKSELPYKFCIIGYDLANNKTSTKEFVLK